MTITDDRLLDDAVLFLVYNGYSVYVNNDDKNAIRLCFTTTDEEITEITHQKIETPKQK